MTGEDDSLRSCDTMYTADGEGRAEMQGHAALCSCL